MDALHLFKYSGSQQIFWLLSKFPDRRFTINELARESGVPFASAWRLVRRWEPAGIIETGRVGKSVTVKLRRSGYTDSVSSMLDASRSPQAFTVQVLRGMLARNKRIREAHLFGSVARGAEKPASDIDVAVLADRGFDANELVFEVYRKYGTKLVPLVFGSKKGLGEFLAGKGAVRLK